MVICLERGADLHMAQLMPLPFTVSCFSKIQICFIFLVLAHLGSPGKRAVKRVCVIPQNKFRKKIDGEITKSSSPEKQADCPLQRAATTVKVTVAMSVSG